MCVTGDYNFFFFFLQKVALMPLPDEEMELYYEKHPKGEKGGGWENKAPARIAAKVRTKKVCVCLCT
jgi:hypothetical protein